MPPEPGPLPVADADPLKRDTRFLLSAGNGSPKPNRPTCAERRSPSQMSIDNRTLEGSPRAFGAMSSPSHSSNADCDTRCCVNRRRSCPRSVLEFASSSSKARIDALRQLRSTAPVDLRQAFFGSLRVVAMLVPVGVAGSVFLQLGIL